MIAIWKEHGECDKEAYTAKKKAEKAWNRRTGK
jgi:hypothetical protein